MESQFFFCLNPMTSLGLLKWRHFLPEIILLRASIADVLGGLGI